MELTREMIVGTKKDIRIQSYLGIQNVIASQIEGRVCGPNRLPHLALIAGILREGHPDRFCYLEIGVRFGGSMCAVACHQSRSKIEKYAGVDQFLGDYDASAKMGVTIERADRNIRYFGPRDFALFQGRSEDQQIVSRVKAYTRGAVHLLYIDGDHTNAGISTDFLNYSPFVVPGGVIVFDDYHENGWPDVTEFLDATGFDGDYWNVIGPIIKDPPVPTAFVIQRKA